MKKITVAALVIIMLVIGLAVPCVAADGTGTPLAEALGDLLINTLLPLLVVTAGMIATFALYRLKNWLHIKTSEEFDRWAQTQAEAAVQYAGEMAAAKLKQQKIKIGGNEKLNLAVAQLVTKVPNLSREQAEALVHAALARIHGEGATGDSTLTVPAS